MPSVVLRPNVPAYAEGQDPWSLRTAGSAYAPGAITGLAAPIPATTTLMSVPIRCDGFNSFMLIASVSADGVNPTAQVYVLDPDSEAQLAPPTFVDSFVYASGTTGIFVFGGGTASSGDKAWKLIRIDIVNGDPAIDIAFFNGRLHAGVR